MIGTNNYSSALALDAADGVIDGRFYGAQIGVTNGAAYSGAAYSGAAYGASYGAAAYPTAAYPTAAYPTAAYPTVAGATYSGGYYGAGYTGAGYTSAVAAPVYRTGYLGYGYGLQAATSALSLGAYPAAYPAYASVVRPVTQYAQVVLPQVVAPPPVQLIQAPPQVQVVQSPPEVRYIPSPPEVRYIERPPVQVPVQVPVEDPSLRIRIGELEAEIAQLRARLAAKAEVRSQTSVHQTYKVKSFDIAAKLAVMDGTDDGLYNGLPIEVEGEGLYRDLVARGRKPTPGVNTSMTGRTGSMTTTTETYKVQSFDIAAKLSLMDGTDDGKYNGLPIEVAGQGLYSDLLKARRAAGWNR